LTLAHLRGSQEGAQHTPQHSEEKITYWKGKKALNIAFAQQITAVF